MKKILVSLLIILIICISSCAFATTAVAHLYINDKEVKPGSTTVVDERTLPIMTGTADTNIISLEYTLTTKSKTFTKRVSNKTEYSIILPGDTVDGEVYTLTCRAFEQGYKSDDWSKPRTYYLQVLDVEVKSNNKELKYVGGLAETYTLTASQVQVGKDLVIEGGPEDDVEQIEYNLYPADTSYSASNIKKVKGSSCTIQLPETAVGKEYILLARAYNVADDDEAPHSWRKVYKLKGVRASEFDDDEEEEEETTDATVKVQRNGKELTAGTTYIAEGQDILKITGTSSKTISKIQYTFDGETKTVNGSSCEIEIDSSLNAKLLELKCKCMAQGSTTWSEEKTYKFQLIGVDVKYNNKSLPYNEEENMTPVNVNTGDSVEIIGTPSSNVKQIRYGFSTEDENGNTIKDFGIQVVKNASSYTF